MIHDPTQVTSFGCGCNKTKGSSPNISATPRRTTVYQVLASGEVVNEFESLPAARKEALAVGGRVKVASKVV